MAGASAVAKSAHQTALEMAEARGALRGLRAAIAALNHRIQSASGAELAALGGAFIDVQAAIADAERVYDAAVAAWETSPIDATADRAVDLAGLMVPDLSPLPTQNERQKYVGCRRVR